MSFYPALDIARADHGLVLAVVDDFAPVAAEERGASLLVFFQTDAHRDDAAAALAMAMPHATVVARDVDDEDWARRSQQNLAPVTVGAITITGDWGLGAGGSGFAFGNAHPAAALYDPQAPGPGPEEPQSPAPSRQLLICIQPSMGFGTGHHATTRLCVAALQTLDLRDASVLDVGTGSGVLAIAARRLGAAHALGVDTDPDAIQSARENLPLNPEVDRVAFELRALGRDPLPQADLVTANLTGALLCRTARALIDLVHPGGHLIVSGLMTSERDAVRGALAEMTLTWEEREEEWVALCLARTLAT
jgi:ribosomal protein L11 methyltransferase